ncbi:alpha/beta hydrolase [Xanthomonadaceae bacterium XH05]|nr:alpha/beta hydrolase [Xanthomonadaceae bacterium XH05]
MLREARGLSRLAVEAVTGATDIAEDLHRTILSLAPVVGRIPDVRAGGLTGMIYRSVRGIARATGTGIDVVLSSFETSSQKERGSPRRDALLAALNGVVGDHLEASGSPLAIPMRLRCEGRDLAIGTPPLCAGSGSRLLVMVHGLCMNDLQWRKHERELGAVLADGFGFTPLHLHYNTGLAIERNGEAFALLLQDLVDSWPQEVKELVIVGHSMGGLVTQSAWRHAHATGQRWPALTSKRFYLGSPLQGAPLERSGEWFNRVLGGSPYLAPFTRLGNLRSQGIKDLRHGIGTDRRIGTQDTRGLHLIAASRRASPKTRMRTPAGDGLVPVDSALGRHHLPARAFPLSERRRHVIWECSHLDLLWHPGVHECLAQWMRQG